MIHLTEATDQRREVFARLVREAFHDLVHKDDIRSMLEDATKDSYCAAYRQDDEGFVGARVNGRHEMHDEMHVCVHTPKEVTFWVKVDRLGEVPFIATRIDSPNGDVTVYEVRRK